MPGSYCGDGGMMCRWTGSVAGGGEVEEQVQPKQKNRGRARYAYLVFRWGPRDGDLDSCFKTNR